MRSHEFRKIINIVKEASGSGSAASGRSGSSHSGSSGSGRMSPISENIKISKLAANYKEHALGRERCGNCTHFITPEYCEIVEGLINPGGWCKYHEPHVLETMHRGPKGSGRSGSDHSGSAHSGRSGSAHSGRSGSGISERYHIGSGSAHSGISGRSGSMPTLDEKWGTTTAVNPEERGKYHGKSKAELLKSYNALKASGPHKQGSKEFGRMRELAFAIRAKGGWGKVKEE